MRLRLVHRTDQIYKKDFYQVLRKFEHEDPQGAHNNLGGYRVSALNNDNFDRFVTIGNVHGDYKQYLTILKDNNLIDSELDWTGARTHLVQ